MDFQVRIRFNDLTYNQLKVLSQKVGLPITKVVKNIVIHKLVELKGDNKK